MASGKPHLHTLQHAAPFGAGGTDSSERGGECQEGEKTLKNLKCAKTQEAKWFAQENKTPEEEIKVNL